MATLTLELLPPSNTEAEIREKMALYFDAGAKEVWTCSASGVMSFFSAKGGRPLHASRICPPIPKRIKLR